MSNKLLPFLVTAGLGVSCTPRPAATSSADSMVSVSEVLSQHTTEWMSVPGVTGTGEGEKDGKPAVMIFVDHKTKALEQKLPKQISGYPVLIEETGHVQAN